MLAHRLDQAETGVRDEPLEDAQQDPAWTAAQRHAMPVKVTPTSCSIHRNSFIVCPRCSITYRVLLIQAIHIVMHLIWHLWDR